MDLLRTGHADTPEFVFGFPNMFIGIVAFAVIITTAMGILAGARFARWYWLGLQAGVTLGFAFVVWLWSQARTPSTSCARSA